MNVESRSGFWKVPEPIMDSRRKEIDNQEMAIIEGELPPDLQGYVFMVAPVGTIDSEGRDGNTLLSGDGMIYRFDFTRGDRVMLKTKLMKPPDYILDEKIEKTWFFPFRSLVKFRNHGVARFSYLFGARNLLNTAFLPLKFRDESSERLLVTYDAGRPYEVDPVTLKLLSPIGKRNEWRSTLPLSPFPFDPLLSTAHPAFDPYKQEMFTVNYGRSLSGFFNTEEGKEYQEILQQEIREERETLSIFLENSDRQGMFSESFFLEFLLEKLVGWANTDFVDLIRWDGEGRLKKWRAIDPDGNEIKINQSMHQIGVTQDYVVLLDSSFTVGIEQVFNLPWLENKKLEAKLRECLTLKPSPNSDFYIIRRDELQTDRDTVVARKITIPREASHFLVDYDNPNDKITLHVAHICAWHVGEWLRDFDRSPYNNQLLPEYIHGMQQSAMDISKMGRYEIDLRGTEPQIESKIIKDELCTWGAGLFAYLDRLPSTGMTPAKLDNIYWISYGLWQDLTTNFMYKLYEDYEYREIDREEILELAKEGIPATLFRLDTSSNEAMQIADSYQFPNGHIVLSPQFVPRKNGAESSTNGYIVCGVFTPENDQIWIFDAEKLKEKGPICKLFYSQLNFGLSLHTTWFKDIISQKAKYHVPIREDYQNALEALYRFISSNFSSFRSREPENIARRRSSSRTQDMEDMQRQIQEIFEEEIYPNFD
ncbi:MAG: carotenoid oxygenase family protein [Prochloraceae cyanobacterium]